MNIIFSSCGNDSLALIQWTIDQGMKNVHVAYSDTRWGSDEWPARVQVVKHFCEANGIKFHAINSEGFAVLCLSVAKQAFPMDGKQFCTEELKINPSKRWLARVDPEKESTCYTGVRREESAKRADWPEWIEESDKHEGRSLCSPLVRHTTADRDALLLKTGIEILPYRSRECWPCVNSNKMDIRDMSQKDVDKVAALETLMGVGKRSGKPKYMFRSKKVGGAKGIVEVKKWASHTKFIPGVDDMFGGGCDSGFCGD